MTLLLLGCASQEIVVEYGGPAGGKEEPSPADTAVPSDCPEGGGSGLPVGGADCLGGVCEVPEGAFWMGSAEGLPDECPPRRVTLSSYAIDAAEVGLGDYLECVEEGACTPLPGSCTDWLGTLDAGIDGIDGLPAICVTWEQASAYCAWGSGRLPTEAEWEKAARGSQGSVWAWGGLAPDCERVNFRFTTHYCADGVKPVGSHVDWTGPYGLLDTAGNVWEWVSDSYDAAYYAAAPAEDPQGPDSGCRLAVWDEPGECVMRSMRGGAYNTTEAVTRGSARSYGDPGLVDVNIGFRCAYDR